MGIVIDSNLIIEFERGRIDLQAHVRNYPGEQAFVSAITASEIQQGIFWASNSNLRLRRVAFVERILFEYPILPIDRVVADVHAKLWFELTKSGAVIGVNDSWIAATCLANNCRLATQNEQEFNRVPNLIVEVWK